MEIGTASAAPGELDRGYLDVTDLPTGIPERLPVVIARGEREGPTLWITAAIHGDEVTAMATAQDVLREELPEELRGTIVCLPNLNPAGLRRTERTSYYDGDDPNRYFPDPDAEKERTRPPNVQELIDERIYELFADSADALIDLHTASSGSMPFAIRDRVLYDEPSEGGENGERDGDDERSGRTEAEAEALAEELDRLVSAFGLPVVNEYEAEEYVGQRLQRSTAGAALNNAGIPAFTPELGGHSVVEEEHRAAGVAGIFRVLVELDMLDAVPEDVADADPGIDAPVEYPVRRAVHPHAETPGIARHRVEAADVVEEGDVIAEIVAPTGERKDLVESDHDGYVLGRRPGVAIYENDALASMAVRDEGELVVPRD